MAKIKFGTVITDSRGHIGGHTFMWTRAGNQWIKKGQPSPFATTTQSNVRANFGMLSKNWWQNLTPEQRDDWRALAAANPRPNTWGDEFPLTGLALYISLNRRLHTVGLPAIDDAPADQFVSAPATATLTIAAPATASLAWTVTPLPTDHILYARATGPLSPGIANPDGRFQHIAESSDSQGSPWELSAEYSAVFGSIVATRQYFLQLAMLNTSNAALSPFVLASAIAT